MKVAINGCHGGFRLSTKAFEMLIKKRGWTVTHWKDGDYADPEADLVENTPETSIWYKDDWRYDTAKWDKYEKEFRTHPDVIWVIEKLKEKAAHPLSKPKIVEIPDGIEWEIEEYDGWESIHEKHKSWG